MTPEIFKKSALSYPYPIAVACKRYGGSEGADLWEEWGLLSRDVLHAVLQYLSHMLLSDLVSSGHKPARLYHRIQSVLSRPLSGHYVGFLRETARYYRDEGVKSSVPELVEFLVSSEVECGPEGKGLLGQLVEYRNLWAHGKIDNRSMMEEVVGTIRTLTGRMLEGVEFLTKYPLELGDGTPLMGWDLQGVPREPQPMVIVTAGGVILRPLLLKLKGEDVVLLEDFDVSGMKLSYRGSRSYQQYRKKDLQKGEAGKLFEEMKDLLNRVRSREAVLPQPDWESFRERSSVMTEETLALYSEMNKYVPDLYVPRMEWEGKESVYGRFLDSDRTLLAISGVQGTGKSALAARLVERSRQDGHAVLFINAQRFSFAEVKFQSVNPYPEYFARALYYEGGLDRNAFRRIIRTADEGKKVILFIDAINEVDGLTDAWNRFKAMDLLLEWIAEVAQPGLKIVLSFRLEVYEEFEYLQEDELPKNVKEIAWQGNNPRKTWVTDLEPFNEEQARALFEKLQGKTAYGMSPAMSWDQIREGLGEHLGEIIENPLVFTVFLRAHNGEKQVINRSREDIFIQYAGKLTGSLEDAKKPWYRKVWGFIRNGNVTPKEQFLADMLDKMSEEGGAAFLQERLHPNNDKRDRRLQRVIDDPHDETFKELKNGGMIAEERIDLERDGKQIASRRITFVGELLAVSIQDVRNKQFDRRRLRKLFESILILFSLVVIMVPANWVLSRALQAASGFPERYATLVSSGAYEVLYQAELMIWPLLAVVFIQWGVSAIARKRVVIVGRDIGLYENSIDALIGRRERSFMFNKLLVPSILPLICLIVVVLLIGVGRPDVEGLIVGGIFGLVGIICCLIAYLATANRLGVLVRRSVANGISRRVFRSLCIQGIAFLQCERARRARRVRLRNATVAFVSGIPFALYALWVKPHSPVPTVALSTMDLLMQVLMHGMVKFKEELAPTIAGLAFGMGLLAYAGEIWVSSIDWRSELWAHRHFVRYGLAPPPRGFLVLIHFLVYAVVVMFAVAGFCFHRPLVRQFSDLGPNEPGEVRTLNWTHQMVSQTRIDSLASVSSLDSLMLPDLPDISIVGEKLPNTDYLSLGSVTLIRFEDAKVNSLVLTGEPRGWRNARGRWGLQTLTIGFDCSDISNVPELCPHITALTIGEQTGRNTCTRFPPLWRNLVLTVESSDAPKLDWLNKSVAGFIISLRHAPNDTTQNMNMLSRAFIPTDDLIPSTLKRATSLRWLTLVGGTPKTAEWYDELAGVVKSSMPGLTTLEYRKGRDKASLRSAFGKDEMIELIAELKRKSR